MVATVLEEVMVPMLPVVLVAAVAVAVAVAVTVAVACSVAVADAIAVAVFQRSHHLHRKSEAVEVFAQIQTATVCPHYSLLPSPFPLRCHYRCHQHQQRHSLSRLEDM